MNRMYLPVISSAQKYKITVVLIALNVAMFIYTSIIGGNFLYTNIKVLYELGQVNGVIIYYGAYYQLFTSLFVHVSVIHLAGNMLFLLIFGLRAEEMFSLPEYLAVYFLSGLAGNLLSMLPIMGLWIPSAGASGAIFGVFGACAVYARKSLGQSIIGAFIFGFFLLMMSAGENVNYLAHIGGLVGGIAIGYVFARRRKPQTTYQVTYNYGAPF